MDDSIKNSESSLKMLLTAPLNNEQIKVSNSPSLTQINAVRASNSSPTGDVNDESQIKIISFYNQTQSTEEKETNYVEMDHPYSRPWNWRPESSYVRTTKCLFIKRLTCKSNPTFTLQKSIEEKDIVDVDTISPSNKLFYDEETAHRVSTECVRFANAAKPNSSEDWEDNIQKSKWTSAQHGLYSSMLKILHNDRLGKLACAGSRKEPIVVRTVIDKSVQRTRILFASYYWDTKLMQWLHNLLIEHLSSSYLAAYLEILMSLKSKVPKLVERMIFSTTGIRCGPLSNENVNAFLKKPWDPVIGSLKALRPKRLPSNATIVIVPPILLINDSAKYVQKWVSLCSAIANTVLVSTNIIPSEHYSVGKCMDFIYAATRNKIHEIRIENPNSAIVLFGISTGASVTCQISETEAVAAIVCIGFPFYTTHGPRGEPDDPILEIQHPVLFIVGQNSTRSSREEIEDMRERMKVETGLVVVGCSDDLIRMNKKSRKEQGLTQSIVDRCVLDEISEFVGNIITAPLPPVPRPTFVAAEQPSDKLRVRNDSNCSSIESGTASPKPKNSRRGRPVGSGKKKSKNSVQQNQTSTISPSSTAASVQQNIVTTNSISKTTTNSTTVNRNKKLESIMASSSVDDIKVESDIDNQFPNMKELLQSSKPQNSTSPNSLIIGQNNQTAILENIPVTCRGIVTTGQKTSEVLILADGSKYVRTTNLRPTTQIVRTIGKKGTVLPVTNKSSFQKTQNSSTGILTQTLIKRPAHKPNFPKENMPISPLSLSSTEIMNLPIIFADKPTKDKAELVTTGQSVFISKSRVQEPGSVTKPSQPQFILKRPTSSTSAQPVKFAKVLVNKGEEIARCSTANNFPTTEGTEDYLLDFNTF